MSFRFPYLALDVETTGLDRQRSHVLQLAAIYDNGKPLEELQTFNEVLSWPLLRHAEEYAMHLNRHLLEQAFRKENVLVPEEARSRFAEFLNRVQPSGRITAAGKNLAGFDIPILTNATNYFDFSRVNRRVLDPGSMFTEEFRHIPSLDELNKFLGRASVSHDALDDCWDVVHAVRYKWGV